VRITPACSSSSIKSRNFLWLVMPARSAPSPLLEDEALIRQGFLSFYGLSKIPGAHIQPEFGS
jgi:hypothetical protein